MGRVTIGLVGPCAAGKSTLAARLKALGYRARHIAQEHSYVPYMWKRMANPDVLIFLDVSYENTLVRRKLDWTQSEYEEQLHRLRHARQYADLIIQTDALDPEDVLNMILAFLKKNNQNEKK